jgi:hypothetical protein
LLRFLGIRTLRLRRFLKALFKTHLNTKNRTPQISESRAQHILYGDKTGGGHKYGVGIPCKTEFPADWGDDDILSNLSDIAANDNLTWREEPNGYHVAEDVRGTLKIRVVLGPKKQQVITGYPVNLPRNPCPSRDSRRTPANDN